MKRVYLWKIRWRNKSTLQSSRECYLPVQRPVVDCDNPVLSCRMQFPSLISVDGFVSGLHAGSGSMDVQLALLVPTGRRLDYSPSLSGGPALAYATDPTLKVRPEGGRPLD
uniref:(northern house mosquito) hypothetical protein n=1 Tax=Culex pipiens TaxID=7175 RepID=A0A8D8G1J4_CULPI